jgi:hypothetical protein
METPTTAESLDQKREPTRLKPADARIKSPIAIRMMANAFIRFRIVCMLLKVGIANWLSDRAAGIGVNQIQDLARPNPLREYTDPASASQHLQTVVHPKTAKNDLATRDGTENSRRNCEEV